MSLPDNLKKSRTLAAANTQALARGVVVKIVFVFNLFLRAGGGFAAVAVMAAGKMFLHILCIWKI
jgi:hypothetical protein